MVCSTHRLDHRAADKYQIPVAAEMAKNQLKLHEYKLPFETRCALLGEILPMPSMDAIKVVCLRRLLEKWDATEGASEWQVLVSKPGVWDEIMRLIRLCNKFMLVVPGEGGIQ
ncbi:hypothetical protein HDV00_002834 [Rhizophlyctis rosea]|nr:hypothetical protein HDV00_002834 [Rhizophlyctis rosea]